MKIIMPKTIVRLHQDTYSRGLQVALRWPDINKQWHWVVGDRELMESAYGGHQVEVPAFEYEAAVAVEDSMLNSMLDGLSGNTAYYATSTRKKKKEDKKGKHVDWLDSQVAEVRKVGSAELI